MTNIIFLVFLLALVSCKQLTGGSTGANDGALAYSHLGGDRYIFQGLIPQGGVTGRFFRLRFRLPATESLRFFFFTRADLSGGMEIEFTRAGDDVLMALSLNGVSQGGINLGAAGAEVGLDVDIHNDHTDAHVLLWRRGGPYGTAEDCEDLGGCLFNTEYHTFPNPGPWGSQGRGAGAYWGFAGDIDLILEIEEPRGAKSNV